MRSQPIESYVSSRSIGDATVTVISEGTLPWAPEIQALELEWRRAMPEADANGVLPLGINVVHIRTGDASILVDPGFDDPESSWQLEHGAASPGLTRTPGLEAGLAGIGVAPDQITHVLITHSHKDHFCGVAVVQGGRHVPRFPNARHLLGRHEWEGSPDRDRPDYDLSLRLGPVERQGLLDLVDGEREVVPGVTMIPAPGESPGHSIIRLRAGGESFYYVGDLFHHACEVEHSDWVSAGRDRAAMRVSRERLIAEAVPSGATVVFTHGPFPPWGRIVLEGEFHRWQRI